MNQSGFKLKQIELSGYKSINNQGVSIRFGEVTVLLGANGAGKSNLVSFFKLLNYLAACKLQLFVGENGYAQSLLHYGPKTTPIMEATLTFENEISGKGVYHFTLSHASGDILIFSNEEIKLFKTNNPKSHHFSLGAGHSESKLKETGDQHKNSKDIDNAFKIILNLISDFQVFQFHDTTNLARIRNNGYIGDNRYLRTDGGNLAAFLYMMQNHKEWNIYYQRIVRYIGMIIPQFGDFILNPSPLDPNQIRLDWKENDSDYIFGPHQISDGGLRFMAMTTLLLQPPELMPGVILIDEPELGLHPVAISALAGMIQSASEYAQIVIATQSPQLVDQFDVGNITIVERDKKAKSSLFKKLDEKDLAEWLDRYSTSELWEKNIFGGRP